MKVTLQIEYNPGQFTVAILLKMLKAFNVGYYLLSVDKDHKTIPLNIKPFRTIGFIMKTISREIGMPEKLITSKTRKRPIVENRQLAMYFSRQITKESLESIGNSIGNKDHATVIHACKTVNNLRQTNKLFRKKFEYLEKILTT